MPGLANGPALYVRWLQKYYNLNYTRPSLLPHMKTLVAVFFLLMSGIGTAQDVHPEQKNANTQCVAVLRFFNSNTPNATMNLNWNQSTLQYQGGWTAQRRVH
jgi:hypothetical protein